MQTQQAKAAIGKVDAREAPAILIHEEPDCRQTVQLRSDTG